MVLDRSSLWSRLGRAFERKLKDKLPGMSSRWNIDCPSLDSDQNSARPKEIIPDEVLPEKRFASLAGVLNACCADQGI